MGGKRINVTIENSWCFCCSFFVRLLFIIICDRQDRSRYVKFAWNCLFFFLEKGNKKLFGWHLLIIFMKQTETYVSVYDIYIRFFIQYCRLTGFLLPKGSSYDYNNDTCRSHRSRWYVNVNMKRKGTHRYHAYDCNFIFISLYMLCFSFFSFTPYDVIFNFFSLNLFFLFRFFFVMHSEKYYWNNGFI